MLLEIASILHLILAGVWLFRCLLCDDHSLTV